MLLMEYNISYLFIYYVGYLNAYDMSSRIRLRVIRHVK